MIKVVPFRVLCVNNNNNFGVLRMSSSNKRKGEDIAVEHSSSKKIANTNLKVNFNRVKIQKENKKDVKGPILYWMSRDQRMNDNWALLYALQKGRELDEPVAVVFNLVEEFLGAGARQFGFMLRGLKELEAKLNCLNIPFFLLKGDPVENVSGLVNNCGASLLVTDFSPLRLGIEWREGVCKNILASCHVVDTHNIVPVWKCSDKREYAARTIRTKINKGLKVFLTEFPEVEKATAVWRADLPQPDKLDWNKEISSALAKGKDVPEVEWCKPGENEARQALENFLNSKRLALYGSKRNDPNVPEAQSNLSPYFHFGHLSTQRAALEANKFATKNEKAVESFLEEMIVRKELSDNYCYYTPDNYDKIEAAAQWAQDTLKLHSTDKREHIYTRQKLEHAQTHDDLWNAAQLEMVYLGKMHGYVRMYWAKKILEWTESPEQALDISIYLNDKYELDGRDPNGIVGCMWSIAGIHDQGWREREVFGKIRYMNYAGCKRKFDIPGYVARVNAEVRQIKSESKSNK